MNRPRKVSIKNYNSIKISFKNNELIQLISESYDGIENCRVSINCDWWWIAVAYFKFGAVANFSFKCFDEKLQFNSI